MEIIAANKFVSFSANFSKVLSVYRPNSKQFMLKYVCNVVLKPFLFKHGVTSRDTGENSVFRTVKVKVSRNRPRWPNGFRVD